MHSSTSYKNRKNSIEDKSKTDMKINLKIRRYVPLSPIFFLSPCLAFILPVPINIHISVDLSVSLVVSSKVMINRFVSTFFKMCANGIVHLTWVTVHLPERKDQFALTLTCSTISSITRLAIALEWSHRIWTIGVRRTVVGSHRAFVNISWREKIIVKFRISLSISLRYKSLTCDYFIHIWKPSQDAIELSRYTFF